MEKPIGPAEQRLKWVIETNEAVAASCKVLLELLKNHPELDKHFCKAFGILPMAPQGK